MHGPTSDFQLVHSLSVLICHHLHWQDTHPHPSCAPSFSTDGPSLPEEITNEVPAAERAALYHSASCLFVTTRILVVDLLSGRVAAKDIAGLLVLNAQRWARGRAGRRGVRDLLTWLFR